MASFGDLVLTTAGLQAQVLAQSGTALQFSLIKMGDGSFAGNIATLTDLVNPIVTLEIADGYIQNNAYVADSFFSNDDLNTGFYWREIGLFMRDTSGNDVLYAYANAGNNYDYIPATADERYAKRIRIATAIGQAENVTIVEAEGFIYVDRNYFDEVVNSLPKSFLVENVTLTADMYSADTTYTGFPYKVTIPIEGVTEDYIADVVFSPSVASSGNFAEVTHTAENAVLIFAKAIPESEIIVPTVEVRNVTAELTGDDDDGGGSGGGLDDSNIATDEEVGDIIDDIFGEGSGDITPDNPDDSSIGDDNIATDEEVGDVIEDVFGDGSDDTGSGGESSGGEDTGGDSGDGSGDSSGDDTTGDETTDDNIATDEEVKDVIDDIFGEETTGEETTEEENNGNVATDEEVQDVIDNIFG